MGRGGSGGRSSNRSSREGHGSGRRETTPWDWGAMAIVSGVFFIGFLIPTIVLPFVSLTDAVCNEIESITRGEQRICQPRKTQDVKISKTITNMTAYRYNINGLPEIETRTTKIECQDSIYKFLHHDIRFTLFNGGTINITCHTVNETRADFFLMTSTQFEQFRLEKDKSSEWSKRNASFVSTVFTTKDSGVYYIIVDAQYERVSLDENVAITTSAYKVSNATAKETCTKDCRFKKVHKDEIVILEYLGFINSYDVKVYSGKYIDSYDLSPLFAIVPAAAVFLAGVIAFGAAAIKKAKERYKGIALDRNDTPKTTPGTTPSSDPATPLIPTAARGVDNPPVYNSTEFGI